MIQTKTKRQQFCIAFGFEGILVFPLCTMGFFKKSPLFLYKLLFYLILKMVNKFLIKKFLANLAEKIDTKH